MISANSAREAARDKSAKEIATPALFYIEQYIRAASERRETSISFILGDEMKSRPDAQDWLVTDLEKHGYSVTKSDSLLAISWAE